MGRFIDLRGRRFGRLTAMYRGENTKYNDTTWVCICDCGNQKTIRYFDLISGKTISCGCYKAEDTRQRMTTHGESHTRLHDIWRGMIKRCEAPYASRYDLYGGRGIGVCAEWHTYENFAEWAKQSGYRDDLSIDRIDPNGNYCPENCRWATAKEQSNNTSRNHYVEYDGKRYTISELAEIKKINAGTLRSRIDKLHWPIDKAVERRTTSG